MRSIAAFGGLRAGSAPVGATSAPIGVDPASVGAVWGRVAGPAPPARDEGLRGAPSELVWLTASVTRRKLRQATHTPAEHHGGAMYDHPLIS